MRCFARMWWRLRVWWSRCWGDVALRVRPKLRTLTYRRFERGCFLLGLDPDDVREDNADLSEADAFVQDDGSCRFVEQVCSNHHRIEQVLRHAPPPVREQIVANVAAFFLLQSVRHFKKQAAGSAITPNERA